MVFAAAGSVQVTAAYFTGHNSNIDATGSSDNINHHLSDGDLLSGSFTYDNWVLTGKTPQN